MSDNSSAEEAGPDITDKAIKIAESGPLKSLLGPSFNVFGELLGELSQEYVSRIRQKRNENLNRHHQRVVEVEGQARSIASTELQVEKVIIWAEDAQRIDPQIEKSLAALWQALLANVYRDNDRTSEMLDALRKMDNRLAKFFLNIEEERELGSDRIECVRRLENIGLVYVVRMDFQEVFRLVLLVILLLCLGFMAIYMRSVIGFIFGESGTEASSQIIQSSIMLGIAMFALYIGVVFLKKLGGVGRIKLTSLGVLLRDSGRKFARSDSQSPI